MLALDDGVALRSCVAKIDPQVAAISKGFENDAVPRLDQVARELLKVMRRELFEVVVRHFTISQSAYERGRRDGIMLRDARCSH